MSYTKMKCLTFLLFGLTSALATDRVLQEFINANNIFTAPVYKQVLSLNKDKPNFLISPFSAETVLALTLSGCKGETADEIRNALHLTDDQKKVESAIKEALPTLKGNDLYTLHTANKIYVQENFNIKPEFTKIATEVFQASSENIDFNKKEKAAKTMNDWVEKQTANKIKNLIDPSVLTRDTVTVMINALYFKGSWSNEFLEFRTRKTFFYKSTNNLVLVDTMHHFGEIFKYYECSKLNAKFLELPFKGGDISMTIILPNEKNGVASLENQIDRVFVPHNLTAEVVNVALPKFKIETKIDFKKVLPHLGVEAAFDANKADLSGIAGKKGDLYISEVIQKTFIDVAESGVEAAAATYVASRGYSAIPIEDPPVPKEFIADHPFIFYIKAKGFIIFAGKVSAPDQ